MKIIIWKSTNQVSIIFCYSFFCSHVTNIYLFVFCLTFFCLYIYSICIVMCSIVLCVLNVCKPQEYPGFLRSYANRKIELIKKKNEKKNPFFFLQKLTTVLLPTRHSIRSQLYNTVNRQNRISRLLEVIW